MIDDWIRYEDIEEKRTGYYVKYLPVFTGQDSAVLDIYLYDDSLINDAKKICEEELKIWVHRYPTPLQVLLINQTDIKFDINELAGGEFLLGYPTENGIYMCWGDYPPDKIPKIDLTKESLSKIYAGFKFRTSEEALSDLKKQGRSNRIFLIVLTIWFCLIPGLIAFYGWANPVVSFIALIYSLYIATSKALKLWGIKQKSEREKEKDREELEKAHHHYHCKLNPERSDRLKLENLKKEIKNREQKKIEEMRPD
ncbi:hypothetical protein [Methylophaga sp. UBA5088]|uniref:hypothetical protein n=1 Tax=Methylophaga sp. UBA5088 TaxID=1946898 RepID=UPI00259C7864|nr:hypothetical protein [Methylophaga sp. UBA5088]